MPGALDKQGLAARTIGIAAIAVNVPFINVMQSDFAGNLPREVQCLRRSRWFILQLEVGMKRREGQRHFRPEMLANPLGQFARFRASIVELWDHQVGELEPE